MKKGYNQKIYVANLREYNTLLEIANSEKDVAILQIEVAESQFAPDVKVYKITLLGEKNHVKFVEYLFNKKKEEMDKTIKVTGVI